MTDFGGMGGIKGGRQRNLNDAFEMTVDRLFGDRMRAAPVGEGFFSEGDWQSNICRQWWSALANVDWHHTNGDTASYSFRAAGDLIAAIRGQGDYLDWYCSGPYATVTQEISDAMAAEGWSWTADE